MVRRVSATCSRTPDAGEKKVERDLGSLRFIFDDSREQPFETCMRWKSAQWRTTGSIDHFAADPRYVQLFRELSGGGCWRPPRSAPVRHCYPFKSKQWRTTGCTGGCPPMIRSWLDTRRGGFFLRIFSPTASREAMPSSIS